MLKRWGLGLCLVGLVAGSTGCRCLPGLTAYGNVIDDVADAEWWHPWDNIYHPRLDVSRAGKPDWCGPINSRLCPCRCQNGTWDRYNECHLYPPAYPYQYPAEFFGVVVNTPTEQAYPAEQAYPQMAPPADPLRNESDEAERVIEGAPLSNPKPPGPKLPPPAPEPDAQAPMQIEQGSGVVPASAQQRAGASRPVIEQTAATEELAPPKPKRRSLLP